MNYPEQTVDLRRKVTWGRLLRCHAGTFRRSGRWSLSVIVPGATILAQATVRRDQLRRRAFVHVAVRAGLCLTVTIN